MDTNGETTGVRKFPRDSACNSIVMRTSRIRLITAVLFVRRQFHASLKDSTGPCVSTISFYRKIPKMFPGACCRLTICVSKSLGFYLDGLLSLKIICSYKKTTWQKSLNITILNPKLKCYSRFEYFRNVKYKTSFKM